MFGRVRLYACYADPASLERDRDVVAVKQGMCWPAFFLSVLWALWHRMWLVAALLAAALIGVDVIAVALGANPAASTIVGLGLAAFIGLSANDWRARTLEHRGMRLHAVVAAANAEDAVLRSVLASSFAQPAWARYQKRVDTAPVCTLRELRAIKARLSSPQAGEREDAQVEFSELVGGDQRILLACCRRFVLGWF